MTVRVIKYNGQVTNLITTYGPGASISTDERAVEEAAAILKCDVSEIVVEHSEVKPPIEYVIPPQPAPARAKEDNEILQRLDGLESRLAEVEQKR